MIPVLTFGRAFVAALPEPALLVAGDMTVAAANGAMELLLEAAPQGRHLTSFYRASGILQAVQAALTLGETTRVEHATRASPPRSFDVHVSPVLLGEPQLSAALLIVRDLTREQQVERMRADFVANASHELRTPLATLAGFIETMQGAARHDVQVRDTFLALMKTQTDRMSRLTDDLLSLSRIEISEHVRPTTTVDVSALLHQAASALAASAEAAGCAISLEVEPGLHVEGDADQLLQVFQNLIENAVKYASAGKHVDILAKRTGGATEITVRDFGAGIAPHHIPRLTERFYRVDVQESRTRGGTGLGLAIVKHIINRHRGKLAVMSALGKGSSFTVQLPNPQTTQLQQVEPS